MPSTPIRAASCCCRPLTGVPYLRLDHAHHSSRGTPKALECGHIQKAEGGVADGAALAALQLELEARRLECAELRRENGLMQVSHGL